MLFDVWFYGLLIVLVTPLYWCGLECIGVCFYLFVGCYFRLWFADLNGGLVW